MSRNSSTPMRAWLITIMLALFMVINFMDKAILGIVAKSLMAELHISPSEFGMIASSFFLLFSISAIGFGFLANRCRARRLADIRTALATPAPAVAEKPPAARFDGYPCPQCRTGRLRVIARLKPAPRGGG